MEEGAAERSNSRLLGAVSSDGRTSSSSSSSSISRSRGMVQYKAA